MSIRLDLHVHTMRHSSCSIIDPDKLIRQAVEAGLDGLVITEHAYQWSEEELAELGAAVQAPGFVLLAGFEYASQRGDLLVYGLTPGQVAAFPARLSPTDAVSRAHDLGGVCIAAHPTRANLGFDEEILELPVDAIETQSVNLQPHEQRLASSLAMQLGRREIAASDAHRLCDVGRYATEFDVPVRSIPDLQNALRHGKFRPGQEILKRTGTL